MRPIKFRVWDKKHKMMLPLDDLDFVLTSNGVFERRTRDYHEDEYYWTDQYELMQFTGLTDKNGKEIYEGDILIDEANRKRIVVFDYGAFKVMWNNDNPTQLNLYPLNKHWEVVGNIHENPELLENKE